MAYLLLTLIAVPVLVWGFINAVGTFRKGALPVLMDEHTPAEAPAPADERVAVLCPARDEAAHLPRTLPQLCEQDHPAYRVILIDDASADATPGIADELARRYAHLDVLHRTGEPPADWVGKCWAIAAGYRWLQQAERESRRAQADPAHAGETGDRGPGFGSRVQPAVIKEGGSASEARNREPETRHPGPVAWLCFTDADVHWDPGLLRLAVAHAHAHEADMVSLLPGLTFGSAGEAIVQLQMMLALGVLMPLEKAMDPSEARAIAAGAFILVRRDWYDRIGGHAAVRDKVVEDINLARVLKREGARLRLAMAREHLRCRMYDGFAAQWEGLTKNAFAGLDYSLWRVGLVVMGAMIANVLPPAYLLIALGWLIASPGWGPLAATAGAALACALPARSLNQVRRLTDRPGWYALTMPIGSGLYVGIVLASVWQRYRGGNVWKGRAYRAGGG